jgi:hypothetical protein
LGIRMSSAATSGCDPIAIYRPVIRSRPLNGFFNRRPGEGRDLASFLPTEIRSEIPAFAGMTRIFKFL